MHNQPRELEPYEDCQAKSIQEFGWTSQGMDWGWGQGIKSHHAQTCQGIWLQLSSEASYGLRRRRTFWKPTSLHPFTKKFWSTSCFLLLTSFLKMLISFSSRIWHLPTLPKAPKVWLNDHGVGVLDWPANSPDPYPMENLWGIVKRKIRNKRPKNTAELKATVKETWASIPPQQCQKLITSMPRRIEAVTKANGAPTKYWVHIQ